MSEIVMNFVGVFLWIAVGAVALHYWGGYQGEHQFQFVFAEKQVRDLSAVCLSRILLMVRELTNFPHKKL